MSGFLTQTESWITAAILAGLMLAAWFLGCWRGARLPADERKSMEKTFMHASYTVGKPRWMSLSEIFGALIHATSTRHPVTY